MTNRTKKRLVAACLLLAIAGGVGGAYGARAVIRERRAAQALEAGMAAYARGDHAAAMPHLGRYVGRVKTNAEAMLALAECRRRIPEPNAKHLVSAMAIARAAAEAAPGDVKPLEMILELCATLNFFTELQQTAEKILAIDPKHEAALLARVRALAATGKTAEALARAQEAAELVPGSLEIHDAVVQLMRASKKTPQEILGYAAEVAKGREPSLALALFECRAALAAVESAAQDDPGRVAAGRAAARAAALPPRTLEELTDLVRCLDLLRLQGEVPGVLDRAAADPALARAAGFLAAERAWKSGDAAAAQGKLAALAAAPADTDREVALRALIADAAGAESKDALAELERRTTTGADYWAGVLRGRAALAAGEIKAAIAALSLAALADPEPGFAQYFLGLAHARAGDWRAGAEQLAAAARTDPAWRTARFACTELLAANGRLEEARNAAAAAFSGTGMWADALLYARVSASLVESGRANAPTADSILTDLAGLCKERPEDAGFALLHARVLLAAGREVEAAAAATKLLEMKHVPADGLLALAAGFRQRGNPLADALERAAGSTVSPAQLAEFNARSLAAAGRTDEAREALSRAATDATGPERTRLTLALGRLLDAAGDAGAKDVLAGLAAANPGDAAVQLAVLNSSAAWSDRALVTDTLGRLESISGQGSAAWKLFDARRRLAFEPGASTAAAVVSTLTPMAKDDPKDTACALLLAEAHLALDDRPRAIEALARCANADPAAPWVYPRLIELLQQAGRPAEAEQRLAAFLRISGLSTPLRRQRAELLRVQGMAAEYAQEIKALAALGAEQDRLAYAAERARYKDADAARTELESLLAAAQPSARVVLAAAEFLSAQDGLEVGLKVLERLPEATPADEAARARALIYAAHQRFDEAERLLKDRTAAGPAADLAPAWGDLAQFYLDRDRLADAEATLKTARAAAPADNRLKWLEGVVALRSGKDEGAALDLLAGAAPDAGPDVLAVMQAMRDFKGHADAARLVTALEAAARAHPTSLLAWRTLVTSQFQAGQPARAAASAVAAAQALPASPAAQRLAAESLAQAGRGNEAMAAARRWRSLERGDTIAADTLIAKLAFNAGRTDEALAAVQPLRERVASAAEPKPDDVELVAVILAAAGQVGEAESLLGDRPVRDPAWGAVHFRIAAALIKRPEEARRWLSRLDPDAASPGWLLLAASEAWFRLAAATSAAEDFDRAAAYATLASKRPETAAAALGGLGSIHLLQGRSAEALEAFRGSLAAGPDNAGVANNLAYLLAEQPGGAAEAVPIAERAVALARQQKLPDAELKNFLDTLGVARLRAADAAGAEAAFDEAVRLDPSAADVAVGLAEARLLLGKAAEARALVQRVEGRLGPGQTLPPPLAARLETLKRSLGEQP